MFICISEVLLPRLEKHWVLHLGVSNCSTVLVSLYDFLDQIHGLLHSFQ